MSKFQAVLSTSGTFRIHRSGCGDLKSLNSQTASPLDVAAETSEEIAVELCADFIEEGSMAPDEALDYVRFLPCCGLS